MTWKDKLEIGLKDDAPFRRDNLPDFQIHQDGPASQPDDPTRSPEEPGARDSANDDAHGEADVQRARIHDALAGPDQE